MGQDKDKNVPNVGCRGLCMLQSRPLRPLILAALKLSSRGGRHIKINGMNHRSMQPKEGEIEY